jgi:hypothetical protein
VTKIKIIWLWPVTFYLSIILRFSHLSLDTASLSSFRASTLRLFERSTMVIPKKKKKKSKDKQKPRSMHLPLNGMVILQPGVLVTIAVMKVYEQSNLGRKRFIWLRLPYHCSSLKVVRTGTHTGQEPGGRSSDIKAMKEFCLLAWAPRLAQNPGPPAQGWHHPQWAGLSPINY